MEREFLAFASREDIELMKVDLKQRNDKVQRIYINTIELKL